LFYLEVKALAESYDCIPAQVCLGSVAAGSGEEVISIPGTITIKFLEEKTAATQLQLTSEDIQKLRAAAVAAGLPGDRYPHSSDGPGSWGHAAALRCCSLMVLGVFTSYVIKRTDNLYCAGLLELSKVPAEIHLTVA
jgi:hypothetical protein